MIRPRTECPCCGTPFTPESDNAVTCGECPMWERLDRPEEPLDFGDSAHDMRRSLENYRAVARLKPKS
jgi:hypothetical protein